MIHTYSLNGYDIVLDVFSGSIHRVDPVARELIELYETKSAAETIGLLLQRHPNDPTVTEADLRECIGQVEGLRRAKKLYTADFFAEHLAGAAPSKPVVKALCLHVAHTCNLTCDYCFAAQGRFHGKNALMPFAVGRQALDFLLANAGTRRHLEVDFFGGEPLMNWEVVKQLVAYARSRERETGKEFRFTLTTNGMLLDDEAIDFCNREMHNVVLSLDGRQEVHDRLRRTPSGEGSYATVVPKFQRLVERRGDKNYYIRGTFTHQNTDFTNDVFHMADLGFTELSMEPVVCAPEDPFALTEADLPILFEQYELLAVEMLRREREGRGFSFYHYILDLKGGPCIHKRVAGCGSGSEYLAVTPWGELFPCHQFVGDPAYSMGDVFKGLANRALQDEFARCNVYARPDCADCWARLYCSGGCAANALHASGSIRGTYPYGCALFKKRIECAIMRKIAQGEMEREGIRTRP